MGASITEALMGAGEWNLDLRHDPELLAKLVRYRHVVIYWGETPIFGGPLLWRTPTRAGIAIGGRASDWRLGQDGGGAVIRDKRYLAGTNKLSNPGFELTGADGFPLYWTRDGSSRWTPDAVNAQTGALALRVDTGRDDGKDDVLGSTEPAEALEGDVFELELGHERTAGDTGRLRGRIVFDGNFAPPNLLGVFDFDVDWTDDSTFDDDVVVIDSDHVIMGPCTRPQVITNGGFEDGLTGWDVVSGSGVTIAAGEGYGGGDALQIQDYGGGTSLVNDYDPLTAGDQVYPIAAGDKWQYEADMWADGANGHCEFRVFPGNAAPVAILALEADSGGYKHEQKTIDITVDMAPTGTEAATLSITQYGSSAGRFLVDNVKATRIAGNRAVFRAPEVTLTPERTYKLLVPITGSWPESGPNRQGTMLASVLLKGEGRPDQIITSAELDVSRAETEMILALDITPPSGYDKATLSLVAVDLYGGNVIARRPDLRLGEKTKTFVDVVIPAAVAGYSSSSVTATAPAGSATASAQVIAEDQGDGFVIDDVVFRRVVTPATISDVLADVVVDEDTGLALVELGEVFDPDEELVYDLHFVNTDNREVLKHVSRSGVITPREFRFDSDNVLRSGSAAELFVDRRDRAGELDVVLAYGDLELLDEPQTQQNAEDRPTKVIVIGAETDLGEGRRVVVVGQAELVDPADVDLYGNPVHRILIVEDSSIDNVPYANAFAAYVLEQGQASDEIVELKLADWRAAFWFDVGDTIYPYLPEAGLEDLDNEMTDRRGRPAWPKPVRALERVWALGSGPFRVELWHPGEEPLDLTPWVLWEEKTSAEVHVGTVVPEFVVDPAGGAAVNQFTRFRARRSV